MGAHHFIRISEEGAFENAADSFDFVFNTSTANWPWDKVLSTLRPKGTLILIGGTIGDNNFQLLSLLFGNKGIRGSLIGSPIQNRKMLEFAALHKIEPEIEIMPMSQLNEAISKVKSGDARYRIVLTQN